jgi:hypothetical protein
MLSPDIFGSDPGTRHDGKDYEVVLPDDVEPGERVKVTLEKEVPSSRAGEL